MADPRLEAIAADARRLGWAISWHDNPARIELIVVPTVSNPEQQGFIGLGFGVTLCGGSVACWIWEGWSGGLIDPSGQVAFDVIPLEQEPQRLHLVGSLDQALPVFDRVVRRYMATMRRVTEEMGPAPAEREDWADLEPIAGDSDG
jgi:hypothetical protein